MSLFGSASKYELDQKKKKDVRPNTWLEYFVIRAVGHIEATQLNSNLIASCLAHCEGHFHNIRLWFLQNLLCDRDVQCQLDVGDVDPQPHRPVGWERLTILIEQLRETRNREVTI